MGGTMGGPSSGTSAFDPVRYLDDVLDLVEGDALHAARVDWLRARARAREVASRATSPADTYPYLRDVLRELDDDHSYLADPDEAAEMRAGSPPLPEGERRETRSGHPVARVVVPWHTNTDNLSGAAFADRLRGVVRELDGPAVARWIVDLRTNGGGNMWPMLLGLAPLLDGPTVGWFVDREGARSRWSVGTDAARIDDAVLVDGCRVHHRRRRKACRIAVLDGSPDGELRRSGRRRVPGASPRAPVRRTDVGSGQRELHRGAAVRRDAVPHRRAVRRSPRPRRARSARTRRGLGRPVRGRARLARRLIEARSPERRERPIAITNGSPSSPAALGQHSLRRPIAPCRIRVDPVPTSWSTLVG